MRTDLDLVQHAVVGCLGMILTLGNGAADAVVGSFVFHVFHNFTPLNKN